MPLFNVETADWNKIYEGEGEAHAEVSPWNIGEPQPEFQKLHKKSEIRGSVLDAGCGVGVTSVWLAEQGHPVVGLDLSSVAVERARRLAAERGVAADFEAADLSEFTGYDERFDTVVDSAVFHSMPVALREPYTRRLAAAMRPHARFYALVFSAEAFPPHEYGPRAFTEHELRAAGGAHLVVDEVRPARVHLLAPKPGALPEGFEWRGVVIGSSGLAQLPGWLLVAHRPAA
jgi:SAM-dependent methyltransferase